MTERIQKILARAGIASRRECEGLIQQRRVTVNGRVASIGESADAERDEIRVDGRPVGTAAPRVWVVLNKPKGVVVSDRAQGSRPTARSLVQLPERLIAVGRLDVESEGLVLLTNDGEGAQRLSHPRYEHEKEYRVLLDRTPDPEQLSAWRRGVVLADGYRTRPARVAVDAPAGAGRWIRLVLREGHKRQIRETARALGLSVERLVRVRLGPFHLGALRPGEWRMGSRAEMTELEAAVAPGGQVRRAQGAPAKERG